MTPMVSWGSPKNRETTSTHLDAHAVEKDIGLGFLLFTIPKQLRDTLVIYGWTWPIYDDLLIRRVDFP